jgi:hypothetical protein
LDAFVGEEQAKHTLFRLVSDDQLVLACVSLRFAATLEWGSWMISQLRQQKRIQPLLGFGYSGVVIKAKERTIGSFEERTPDSSACGSVRKRRSRMARAWPPEESGLES